MVGIPELEVLALRSLVERLESVEPLSELQIFRKVKYRKANFLHQTPDEIRNIFEQTRPLAPLAVRGSNSSIFGNTDYDLGYHVNIASAQFDDWFLWAHDPPSYSLRRILVISKRARMLELRDRFANEIQRHLAPIQKPVLPLQQTDDYKFDFLQSRVPRLRVTLAAPKPNNMKNDYLEVEFLCVDCGGFIVHQPDDSDPEGPALCKACGQVFGDTYDVIELAKYIAAKKLGNPAVRVVKIDEPPKAKQSGGYLKRLWRRSST